MTYKKRQTSAPGSFSMGIKVLEVIQNCCCPAWTGVRLISADMLKGKHPFIVSSAWPFHLFSRFPVSVQGVAVGLWGCGGMGTLAQMAMMEFPVFLNFAVQALHVPWGWAGLEKSAYLPITHLAALERKQSALTYGELCLCGEQSDKVCLFDTSSLSFSCLLSLVCLCQEQIHTEMGLPFVK